MLNVSVSHDIDHSYTTLLQQLCRFSAVIEGEVGNVHWSPSVHFSYIWEAVIVDFEYQILILKLQS